MVWAVGSAMRLKRAELVLGEGGGVFFAFLVADADGFCTEGVLPFWQSDGTGVEFPGGRGVIVEGVGEGGSLGRGMELY